MPPAQKSQKEEVCCLAWSVLGRWMKLKLNRIFLGRRVNTTGFVGYNSIFLFNIEVYSGKTQEKHSQKGRAATSMAVDMRLPTVKNSMSLSVSAAGRKDLVVPGDVITSDTGFMRGHGTYVDEDKLTASVAGEVQRVDKLICVRPLKTRFNGEVGDVVVGRITEVQQKRWKVETNSRLDSVLLLSSVNLPGGELRRRSAEDELTMREYLHEGDLISAEVQSVFSDGALSLHTRSLKYGKLGQGVLVQLSPSLIKRQKTHFHNLPCGASIILGNNGFVWLYPTPRQQEEEAGGFYTNLE
ncbi:Exosome complex component RRP4, partial [Ilyodon furcidens]